MENIFYTVLGLTPWISIAILATFCLKIFLKNKFSANMYRILFFAIALRIALPINLSLPKAPIKIDLPAFTANNVVQQAANTDIINNATSGVIDLRPSINFMAYLPLLYFIGVAISLLCVIIPFAIYMQKLRSSRTKLCSGEIYNAVSGKIDVYLCTEVSSPTLCGFLHPCIYISNNDYDRKTARYIVRHELYHKNRGDLWLKLLLVISQSVAFFNPLVYLMVREARRDIEKSCDEYVVENSDIYKRAEYGDLLLSFYNKSFSNNNLVATFSSGKHIKSRFAAIIDQTSKKRGTVIVALAIVLILSASLLVSCASDNSAKSDDKDGSTASISTEQNSKSNPQSKSESSSATISSTNQGARSSSITSSNSQDAVSGSPLLTNEKSQDKDATTSSQIIPGPSSISPAEIAPPTNNISSIADLKIDKSNFSAPIVDYTSETRGFGKEHRGIDLAAKQGSSVFAAHEGTVIKSEFDTANGNTIIIEGADNVTTTYSHMHSLDAEKGAKVKAGTKIGTVGSTGNTTGNHLHFELTINGSLVNPEDIFNFSK